MYANVSKVTEVSGFGAAFGRLIREKRGIESMSQEELAFQAGVTKARISELETGKVANPQARTIDALCVALNITRAERTACYAQESPTLPPLLLENLALRFGYSNPDAREDELLEFLKAKAQEFSEMKQRLAAMDARDGAISALVGEASAALDRGEFDIADAKLEDAETAQLSAATLPALGRQHSLRSERGHAALLAGEVESAARHWEIAANYFHFFDSQLEADRRYQASVQLREYAYRYRSTEALLAAEGALQKNLHNWATEADFSNWCKAMNALGGVYWRLSQFDNPSRRRLHLKRAQHAYGGGSREL
jgi:transcriptional regulator with XRE-family HTH domain